MKTTDNSLNWFEISVAEMPRAKKFYESIFGLALVDGEVAGTQMAFFPIDVQNGKIGGALAQGPFHKPSIDGSKVYLNANPNLSTVLDKVEKSGGKVVLPKTSIGDFGHMAFFIDSEGNVVGLHSNN
jgi:predicted enzyme related to lactoylglutathione lyase